MKKIITVIIICILGFFVLCFCLIDKDKAERLENGLEDYTSEYIRDTEQSLEEQSDIIASSIEDEQPFMQEAIEASEVYSLIEQSAEALSTYNVDADQLKKAFWEYNDLLDYYSCIYSNAGKMYSIIIYGNGELEVYVRDITE